MQSIPVLYSDDSILVVDKPAGLLSVPDRWEAEAPVVSSALEGTWGKLFVVHRLDKDTSGVLAYGRNAEAHRLLSAAFEARSVKKTYRALVRGLPSWEETTCELPLKPDGDKAHRTIVDPRRGKASSTYFKVLSRYKDCALVEARPATGRTHQIRVHLAQLGYPCLCDPLYGDGAPLLLSKLKRRWKGDPLDERPLLSRSALHAATLELAHPVTGVELRLEAPLPKDMRAAINQLEKI